MKTKNRGSTLIELLIATLIFSVALGALLSSLVAIVNVIDLSRERTIATADLRNMLERIRSAPFSSLLTIFPMAWQTARFQILMSISQAGISLLMNILPSITQIPMLIPWRSKS